MFIISPDDVPLLVEQYSNLKDIGQRVELSEKGRAGIGRGRLKTFSDDLFYFSCFFNNTHAKIRLVAAKAAIAAYSCSRSAVCSPLVKLPTLTV